MSDRRIAWVTGGSRGIGRAISVELARAGYYIVVHHRENAPAAEETLAAVRAVGSDGERFALDVAAVTSLDAIAERMRALGGVEVVVHAAGTAADALLARMTREVWESVTRVALDGFFNVCRPAVRHMIAARRGTIVIVSSASALVGNPGQANYAAAKAGLIGASRSLAAEVARAGVRVNVVAPGFIETEMTRAVPPERIEALVPMGRMGRPEEVARVVRFLCSEDASYLTGQVIGVNGGLI